MSSQHEPLSWLTLERYALGELDPGTRARVAEQLASSADDLACYQAILADRSELPPLHAAPRSRPRRSMRALASASLAVSALGLAAAALLTLRAPDEVTLPARRAWGTKGGSVAVSLLSDRAGEAPSSYHSGERFKVLLTCPPDFSAPSRVIVFVDEERSEPLASPAPACGNAVPWEGAFTLDGHSAATICVAWGAAAASARSPEQLGDDSVCTTLGPAR